MLFLVWNLLRVSVSNNFFKRAEVDSSVLQIDLKSVTWLIKLFYGIIHCMLMTLFDHIKEQLLILFATHLMKLQIFNDFPAFHMLKNMNDRFNNNVVLFQRLLTKSFIVWLRSIIIFNHGAQCKFFSKHCHIVFHWMKTAHHNLI